jgi:hypothetical protein
VKTFFEEVGEDKDDGLISTQNKKVDPRCLSVIIHVFHILNLCVVAPFLPCHCTIVWGRKGAWQRGGDSLAGFSRRVRCTFPLHFNSRPYIAALFCFPEPERGPPGPPSMQARSNFFNLVVACVIYPVFFRFSLAVQF